MRGGGHLKGASRGRNVSERPHETRIRTPVRLLLLRTAHNRDVGRREIARDGAYGGDDGARRRA